MKNNPVIVFLVLILASSAACSSDAVILIEGFSPQGIRANFKRPPADGRDETTTVGGNLLGYGKKTVILGDSAKETIRSLENDRRGIFAANSDASLEANVVALFDQIADLVEYKNALSNCYLRLKRQAEGEQRENESLKESLNFKDRALRESEGGKLRLAENLKQVEGQLSLLRRSKENLERTFVLKEREARRISEEATRSIPNFPSSARAAQALGRPSTQGFTKSEIKEINRITGYPFINPDLLKAAFVHSSDPGATTFEQLEFVGDRLIAGLVASKMDFASFSSPGEMQKYFEPRTRNTYFADRYRALGLAKFLRFNPSSSEGKVYADAFEALVGAINLDWKEANPHLCKTGRVFDVLSPILERMLQMGEARPASANGGAAHSTAHTDERPDDFSQGKMQMTLTVYTEDEKTIVQKATGQSADEARHNAMLAIWKRLNLTACKAKDKQWDRFTRECQRNHYEVEVSEPKIMAQPTSGRY